jgi:hypothetical protein
LQEVIESLPDRSLLRVDEVAKFFSKTKRTIYAWYEAEKLKGCSINGVIRIYRKSVVELVLDGNGKKKSDESEKPDDAKIIPRRKKTAKRQNWIKNY